MELLNLSSFKRATGLVSGKNSSVFSGAGIDFRELREYREGDDVRSIDWRSSARTGKIRVKTYESDRDMPVWILSDIGATMGFWDEGKTKLDTERGIVELLTLSALHHGNRSGGCVFSDRSIDVFPLTKSRTMVREMTRSLESPDISSHSSNPEKAFESILSYSRDRSVIFILTDGTFPVGKLFTQICRKHTVFLVIIRDKREDSLAFSSNVRLQSPGDRGSWITRFIAPWTSSAPKTSSLEDFLHTITPSLAGVARIAAGEDFFGPLLQMITSYHARPPR